MRPRGRSSSTRGAVAATSLAALLGGHEARAQFSSWRCRYSDGPDVQRWVGAPVARVIAWFGHVRARRPERVVLDVHCGVEDGPMGYWTLTFDVNPAGLVTRAQRTQTGGYGCRHPGPERMD